MKDNKEALKHAVEGIIRHNTAKGRTISETEIAEKINMPKEEFFAYLSGETPTPDDLSEKVEAAYGIGHVRLSSTVVGRGPDVVAALEKEKTKLAAAIPKGIQKMSLKDNVEASWSVQPARFSWNIKSDAFDASGKDFPMVAYNIDLYKAGERFYAFFLCRKVYWYPKVRPMAWMDFNFHEQYVERIREFQERLGDSF
jgi:hypothetical protein